MRSVNIRQKREEFFKDVNSLRQSPYFRALMETYELIKGRSFDSIGYTYDDNGIKHIEIITDGIVMNIISVSDGKEG